MSEEAEVQAENEAVDAPVEATEATETVEETPEQPTTPSYETKAAEMGWVPEDQWRGDPKQWRPAEEFVKRGENIIPILNDRVSKLQEELNMALKVNKQEIAEIKKQANERAKAEYETKLQQLREKENQAFLEGDQEAFDKIRDERDKITPPEEVKVEEPDNVSPDFEPWLAKNQWYSTDSQLHAYADNIGIAMRDAANSSGSPLSDAELFNKVEVAVKAAFPDKFTNPKRESAPSVEAATDTPKKGGNKFGDLPASAKAQYDRMAKQFELRGRKFTKEQYAQTYFEG